MANFFNFSDKFTYCPSGVNLNNDYFTEDSIIVQNTSLYSSITGSNSGTTTLTPNSYGKFIFDSGQTTYKISSTSTNVFESYKGTLSGFTMYSDIDNGTGDSLYPISRDIGSSANNSFRIHSYQISKSEDGWPIFYYQEDKNPDEELKEIKKRRIKNNLLIEIRSRADLLRDIPENEQVAIETLREEITETEFRKYLKYGFVIAKGQSGKTYQIFRNQDHTKVWKGGKIIEEICVRIKDCKIPPTDNVIAFKNMVQIDEEEFRKMGNVYKAA